MNSPPHPTGFQGAAKWKPEFWGFYPLRVARSSCKCKPQHSYVLPFSPITLTPANNDQGRDGVPAGRPKETGNCGPRVATGRNLHSKRPSSSSNAVVLRYNSEGLRFDSRWSHWDYSFAWCFQSHYGPGVDSDSNRDEYQEYILGVRAARA